MSELDRHCGESRARRLGDTMYLTANTLPLTISSQAWGELRESTDCLDDADRVQQRMREDGYIFVRDFLNRKTVQEARAEALNALAREDLVRIDTSAGQARPKSHKPFKALLPAQAESQAAYAVSGGPGVIGLCESLLGGKARAHDYFYRRALSPNSASETPHCDIVYMGRGTRDIYTVWIPLGDIPLEQGPLMVLEKSHTLAPFLSDYWNIDADLHSKRVRYKHGFFFRGAHYSKHAPAVQRELGLRWLSTDFAMGDIIVFSSRTMHATLDNRSNNVRISIDRRFQLASEPVDSRWNGPLARGNARPPGGILSNLANSYRCLLRLADTASRRTAELGKRFPQK